MTFRAVVLGLLGAAVLCAVNHFNDMVLKGQYLVGTYVPLGVFGGLIVFGLLINPLLGRIHRRLALRGAELATVVALLFAACFVPGRGTMRYLTTVAMLPHHYHQKKISWQKHELFEMVPKQMLADPSSNPDEALNGYVRGLGSGSWDISLSDIPWYAWWRTLAFWIPMQLSISIALRAAAFASGMTSVAATAS